jgi:hypothetical protein
MGVTEGVVFLDLASAELELLATRLQQHRTSYSTQRPSQFRRRCQPSSSCRANMMMSSRINQLSSTMFVLHDIIILYSLKVQVPLFPKGSGTIKAGFAGQDHPKCFFPSLCVLTVRAVIRHKHHLLTHDRSWYKIVSDGPNIYALWLVHWKATCL